MADTHLVKFATGTLAEYMASAKDADTLYFITDEQKIYKGATPYGGIAVEGVYGYEEVDANPKTGTLYYNYLDASLKYYNGTNFQYLVEPIAGAIDNHNQTQAFKIASTKAVYDFVTAEIAKVNADGIGETLEEITDSLDDIGTTLTGKADKATTLDGYGITDAYTKGETDTKIATAVADINHLKYEIVELLPSEDIDSNTIYMVLDPEYGQNDNVYNEYMYINGAFEKIGSTSGDFIGYATDEGVSNALTNAKNQWENADEAIKNEVIDYVDGLAENYATAEQGAKADSAVQEVVEGEVDGTIKVDGSNVSVHGLGTAAYENKTAFDEAGAADDALTAAKAYTDAEIIKALTWQEL